MGSPWKEGEIRLEVDKVVLSELCKIWDSVFFWASLDILEILDILDILVLDKGMVWRCLNTHMLKINFVKHMSVWAPRTGEREKEREKVGDGARLT